MKSEVLTAISCFEHRDQNGVVSTRTKHEQSGDIVITSWQVETKATGQKRTQQSTYPTVIPEISVARRDVLQYFPAKVHGFPQCRADALQIFHRWRQQQPRLGAPVTINSKLRGSFEMNHHADTCSCAESRQYVTSYSLSIVLCLDKKYTRVCTWTAARAPRGWGLRTAAASRWFAPASAP